MPLAEFEKKGGEGGEVAWENARAPLREFAELLGEVEGGPFVLGGTGELPRCLNLCRTLT